MAELANAENLLTNVQVVIVGGGPIGLEMAVACHRQGISAIVLEAGQLGQTISWWAPQTRWFSSNERISIAGVPLLTPDQSKATREQYLTYLRAVAEQFQLDVRCYHQVTNVQATNDGFRVIVESRDGSRQFACQKVVLASGGTDRPKQLGIPGEHLPHVDGYLREPHQYWNRKVLIIGGRNSAVEAALRLHHAGAKVSLSYRQSTLPEDGIKYWLLPEIKSLLKLGRIQALMPTSVVEITPSYTRLLSLDRQSSEQEITTEPDHILSLIGYEQDKTLFHAAGIKLIDCNQRPWHDELTMETSVPGIYVAGTAVAGTQTSHYKTFLENCHVHIDRILAHLQGESPTPQVSPLQQAIIAHPES